MKIAVLSDAHGNGVYFDQCMRHLKNMNLDEIVYLGDCFGYMRQGNEILTKLRQAGAKILMGNHEALLLGILPLDLEKDQIYGLQIDRKHISEDNLEYIKGLQPQYQEQIGGKKILYVHGMPEYPLDGYLYEDNTEFGWDRSEFDVIFMGHTHRPYIKKAGETIYVNVGSCGLPRDIGMAPSYAVYDSCTGEAVIRRIQMSDVELEMLANRKIHPKIYECLKREGKTK